MLSQVERRLERLESLLAMVLGDKCKAHPKYQVNREPRCDCQVCWLLWQVKLNREGEQRGD